MVKMRTEMTWMMIECEDDDLEKMKEMISLPTETSLMIHSSLLWKGFE